MLILNALNCTLWTIYGLAGAGAKAWVCNIIGLSITSVFIVWYLIYTEYRKEIKFSLIFAYCLIVLKCVTFGFYCNDHLDDYGRSYVKNKVGNIAVIVCTIMSAGPSQKMVSQFLFFFS